MVGTSSAEVGWIDHLLTADTERGRTALVRFARQYHWFSQNQVVAFSRMLVQVPPSEVTTLAELAEVLFDELGRGVVDDAHSLVFARFARSVGLSGELPIPESAVVPEVAAYLALLHRCFETDLVAGATAYRFLEASAVASYGPLLAAFRAVVPAADLHFFEVHAELEPAHLARADAAIERLIPTGASGTVAAITAELEAAWDGFWAGLVQYCFAS